MEREEIRGRDVVPAQTRSDVAAGEARLEALTSELERTRVALSARDAEIVRLRVELAQRDAEMARARSVLPRLEPTLRHLRARALATIPGWALHGYRLARDRFRRVTGRSGPSAPTSRWPG